MAASLLLAFGAAHAATPVIAEQAQSCEESAANMAQFRGCLMERLDQTLQQDYQQTLAFVRSRDAQAAALLEKTQQEWQRYWHASCDYTIAARQAPEGENDARLECYMAFANARIKILRNYRDTFGKVD